MKRYILAFLGVLVALCVGITIVTADSVVDWTAGMGNANGASASIQTDGANVDVRSATNLTFHINKLSVSNAMVMGSNLTVSGSVYAKGNASVGGTLTVTGAVTLATNITTSGSVFAKGDGSIKGSLTATGAIASIVSVDAPTVGGGTGTFTTSITAPTVSGATGTFTTASATTFTSTTTRVGTLVNVPTLTAGTGTFSTSVSGPTVSGGTGTFSTSISAPTGTFQTNDSPLTSNDAGKVHAYTGSFTIVTGTTTRATDVYFSGLASGPLYSNDAAKVHAYTGIFTTAEATTFTSTTTRVGTLLNVPTITAATGTFGTSISAPTVSAPTGTFSASVSAPVISNSVAQYVGSNTYIQGGLFMFGTNALPNYQPGWNGVLTNICTNAGSICFTTYIAYAYGVVTNVTVVGVVPPP